MRSGRINHCAASKDATQSSGIAGSEDGRLDSALCCFLLTCASCYMCLLATDWGDSTGSGLALPIVSFEYMNELHHCVYQMGPVLLVFFALELLAERFADF